MSFLAGYVGVRAAGIIMVILKGVAVAAAIGAVIYGIDRNGYKRAEGECRAAAIQSQLDALRADYAALKGRLARQQEVTDAAREQAAKNEAEASELARELAKLKLQSTQPGAKRDPNAILDDRCNYTDTGARRVR